MTRERLRWSAALLLAVVLAAGCVRGAPNDGAEPEPVPGPAPLPYLCWADESAVRSRAEADAPVVTVIGLGDLVMGAPGRDGWLEVEVGGATGWCREADLVPESEWGPLAYERFAGELDAALGESAPDLMSLANRIGRLFPPVSGTEPATDACRDLLAEHEGRAAWAVEQLYPEAMDYFSRSGHDIGVFGDLAGISDPIVQERVGSVVRAGYRVITVEGMLDVVTDPELLRLLAPVAGEPLAGWLRLRVQESERRPAADAALQIPWDEVRLRAVSLDRLASEWPDAPETDGIRTRADWYYRIYLKGMDNSPLFGPDGLLAAELRASYEKFLSKDQDSSRYSQVQEFYELCEQEGFRLTPAVRTYLDSR